MNDIPPPLPPRSAASWDKPPPGTPPSFWERCFDNPRGAKFGCIGFVVAIVVGLALLLGYCSNQRDAQERQESTTEKMEADAREAEYQNSVTNGTVCADGRGGSNLELVDAVKARLRDPDSFEHVQTAIGARNAQGQYPTLMHYRARNGFGGYNVGLAHARLALAGRRDCRVVSIAILNK